MEMVSGDRSVVLLLLWLCPCPPWPPVRCSANAFSPNTVPVEGEGKEEGREEGKGRVESREEGKKVGKREENEDEEGNDVCEITCNKRTHAHTRAHTHTHNKPLKRTLTGSSKGHNVHLIPRRSVRLQPTL